jgi:hypothetical protein
MFLVKGDAYWSDMFISVLSSINMEKEAFLMLFDHYSLKGIDLKKINTINLLCGSSKDILTNKYKLIEWFSKIKFHGNLPAIVFSTFHQKDVEDFLSRGTKHKFLKPSDGFKGKDIHVVDSVEEVKKAIGEKEPSKRSFSGWVLQDALEDIATYQRYKFHLRILIVVVVRDHHVCVFISNFHAYRLSSNPYNITQLKEKKIYNTHHNTNSKRVFFPMDPPDGWTPDDCKKAMHQMQQDFTFIFKREHSFLPDYRIKHGYELLGADVIFDTKHHPYIIEINTKVGFELEQATFIPEMFHLGLGGAPLKLFSTLYGIPKDRNTPFTKPLSTFYGTRYKDVSEVKNSFKTHFHIPLVEESDKAYFEYQTISKHHTRRAKSKSKKSKTLRRGSRR